MNELLKAAQNGNIDYFKDRISNNCFLESVLTTNHQKSGDTVLHYSVRHGHLELLKFLIEEVGLKVELGNFDGKRALHEAAQYGQLDCLKFILSHDINIDSLKRADWTPLMLACTKDNLEIIKCLVSEGASLTLRNKDGWNCFHLAVREGHIHIIDYLNKQDPTIRNTISKNGRSPLHTAAIHGHTDVVDYLLTHCQYDVDGQDSCGSTPFMDAIRVEAVDIAKLLLNKQKVEVSIEDKLGCQAIHIASQSGALKSINYLIQECTVNPCVRCSTNNATSLHIAAKEGHVTVIECLIKYGADIDATDSKGRTALHIAAGAQHADCVNVLLKKGAKCITDESGTSPKELAKKDNVIQIFEDLENT